MFDKKNFFFFLKSRNVLNAFFYDLNRVSFFVRVWTYVFLSFKAILRPFFCVSDMRFCSLWVL